MQPITAVIIGSAATLLSSLVLACRLILPRHATVEIKSKRHHIIQNGLKPAQGNIDPDTRLTSWEPRHGF